MKKKRPVLLGVIGAVLGFAGMMVLLELVGFGNRNDPIMSGMIALFVFGPMGAVGGLLLGTAIGRRASAGEGGESSARSGLKALGILVVLIVVIGGGYAIYAITTATPWLRPAGVILQFEIALPPGAAMPDPRSVKADLQTSVNTMPAEMKPDLFRPGNPPVIVGQVDLAFRTGSRQIELKIPGRMDRTYQIRLKDTPPHTPHLGAWQRHPDGSEIRYRAKWPGQS